MQSETTASAKRCYQKQFLGHTTGSVLALAAIPWCRRLRITVETACVALCTTASHSISYSTVFILTPRLDRSFFHSEFSCGTAIREMLYLCRFRFMPMTTYSKNTLGSENNGNIFATLHKMATYVALRENGQSN